MIVYNNTKEGFIHDCCNNKIADNIRVQFMTNLKRNVSDREYNSWRNSMQYMSNILNTQEISDDLNVAIEYKMPQRSLRVDFIISGLDVNKKNKIIIVELKQWDSAELTEKEGIVKTRFSHGLTETSHPSYQAWSYAAHFKDYSSVVEKENIDISPCAYLHNYDDDDNVISNEFYNEYLKLAPVYFRTDFNKLQNFIKKNVKYASEKDLLYLIENGEIRPSKNLSDYVSSLLTGNTDFVMIDDQKIVFENAIYFANQSKKDKKKRVMIVEGGPGTGKSVVAINLLVKYTDKGFLSKYISKNAAPREVYSTKLSGTTTKKRISSLFGGTGSYYDVEENRFDVLIIDEAHRLNYYSGFYGNQGVNQVKEIIKASKFSIFFIDNDQRIHIKDIGEKSQIEEWAKELEADIYNFKLNSQFRCNGSDGYLSWLDNILDIRETANTEFDFDFDFQIFDDPNILRETIEEKNLINNKSRMVAGYCWKWKSKKDPNAFDVIIPEHNFKMRWNLYKDGSSWIIAENSVNEIGCIHTCQGLELDYVGVIVGEDLRYKSDEIFTDVSRRDSNDHSVRGIKAILRKNQKEGIEIADRIIKNTYRTLMTRGLKGCYVYFCDKELEKYFKEKLKTSI